MRVRSSFNSAVLFAACGLLIAVTAVATAVATADKALRDDPRCSVSLSVVLENGDGNFTHDGVVYPADLRWTDGNLTYGCICKLRSCIRKCCHSDEIIRRDLRKRPLCEKMPREDLATDSPAKTPALRLAKEQLAKEIRDIGELKEHFVLIEAGGDACPSRLFSLNEDMEEKVTLQEDGNLLTDTLDKILQPWDYCLDWRVTLDKVSMLVCMTPNIDTMQDTNNAQQHTIHKVGIIISIPFLIATFLVYAIIPELKNLYGKTLMCYVICLIIAYVFLILANHIYISSYVLCIVTALLIHFSFSASFFWLNVMCFDIWWMFSGFRLLQGNVKQQDRKKFIIYSIYAWGCASILTIICAIMDFVPSVPKNFIRPEIGQVRCWFTTDEAKGLYFYGPVSVILICNICLFISTALKIVRHKKDTAHHLKGSESKRHDDKKQWFNLYLKLFIVMGITWSMEIISWLLKSAVPPAVWYLSDLINTLQGPIIFIIFVCKIKIKKLLLRRFGCQKLFPGISSRSDSYSTTSSICTTPTGVIPLQITISPYEQTNCRTKNSSDETNCS